MAMKNTAIAKPLQHHFDIKQQPALIYDVSNELSLGTIVTKPNNIFYFGFSYLHNTSLFATIAKYFIGTNSD